MQIDEVHEITVGKKHYKPTQNQKILDYLDEHDYITPLDAMNNFGCMRLAARIADLEERGHTFVRHRVMVKNRYGEACSVMAYSRVDNEEDKDN